MSRRTVVLAVLAVLLVAALASRFASSSPDGLERVADDHGFADTAIERDTGLSPLTLGLVGVGLTLVVTGGTLTVVRRRRG